MGACNFVVEGEGTSARSVFNKLYAEAEAAYGYDPYNGTISTTGFTGNVTKVADKYNKTAAKKAIKYIEARDYGQKWYSDAVDAGVVGYEVSTYKKVPRTKADVVYRTVYVAYADSRELGVFKTTAEARKCVEDKMHYADGGVYRYQVVKESRPVSGTKTVTFAYERQTRRVKSLPKNVAKDAKVTPIHHFFFYGWASC